MVVMATNIAPFRVEVRRPLYMKRPTSVFERMRRMRTTKVDGTRFDRIDLLDPNTLARADDVSDFFASLIFMIVFTIAVAALLPFVPWVLVLVSVLIESVFWVVSIAAGFAAVRVLRRPYSVAVVSNETGTVLARAQVFGRGAADHHATVVSSRLGEGFTPVAAAAVYKVPTQYCATCNRYHSGTH